MRIEIDQSGKLEDTHKPTVVSFSNGKNRSIIIFATEKQRLQRYFRKIGKPTVYVYVTFALLIYILVKSEKKIVQIIIDREYPGQEPLIKSYLLTFFRERTKINIDKKSVVFQLITKNSNAHLIALDCYRNKKANIKITANEIVRLIDKKRSGV